MIVKNDIDKLLELYKAQGKQTDRILDLMYDVIRIYDKNTKLIDSQAELIDNLNKEIIGLKLRVKELEKDKAD